MEGWYLYILVGFACGIFSATFGVGSGIILVPTLVLIFALPQKSAQGVCLAVMVPMALAGAIRYKMNPDIRVDMWIVGLLAVGGVVGAVIGAGIAGRVSGLMLRRMFAIIMIIAAVRMLMTPGPKPKTDAPPQARITEPEAPDQDPT
jgi:uncharacterized membrane protein YfcA